MRKNCSDYPVEIVEGVFAEGNAVLADMLRSVTGAERPHVMLVADQNLVNHTEGLGKDIGRWIQANGIELAGPPMLVAGGERAKDEELQGAKEVVSAMLKAKVGKGDAVLAVGGGTLLDVAGWASAQVRGGVPVVRLPTTPAAMVDAAFADYAAVDGPGVKDALRVPCRPAGVVIDLKFAQTVLDGVWRAGFAVALRLALVSDAALAKKLLKMAGAYRERDAAVLKEMVEATITVRRKKGDTSFALWAAHRLEAMSGYKLPYGYAVAIGIHIDAAYAEMRGFLKPADRQSVCEALDACGAMDGAVHSQHLLGRDELLLLGLDAWRLVNGSPAIVVPAGMGKALVDENPDRDTMKRAVNLLK